MNSASPVPGPSFFRIILTVFLPFAGGYYISYFFRSVTLWGVFAVPDDPSRSGKTIVSVPGWLRLMLELLILYGATWALYSVDQVMLAVVVAACITFHYLVSVDRLVWLVKQ